MNVITIDQFIDLIEKATIEPNQEIAETVYSAEDGQPDMVCGWIWNTLSIDGLIISYQNSYEHPVGKPTLATISNDVPDAWVVDQQELIVLDDDGSNLDTHQILEIVAEHTSICDLG